MSVAKKKRARTIRFPNQLLDRLAVVAKKNRRSCESEIIIRLERSIDELPAVKEAISA